MNRSQFESFMKGFTLLSSRYIFSADGKYLVGGMMVGDTSDYIKLVAIIKKKVRLTAVFS